MFRASLAVACACTGAFAQSTVTLYGVIDVSLGQTTDGKFGMNGGKSKTADKPSYHTPTRLGLKGSEDMGDGLKANFNLETGAIRITDGSQRENTWSREAWLGLSGNFGSTRLGLTSSIATQGQARYDLNETSTSSAMNNANISPVTWYGSSRREAQVQYTTPIIGGLDVGTAYSFAADNNHDNKQGSFSIKTNYTSGPLSIGYVAETKRTSSSRTAQAISGSYETQFAKFVGGYVVSETKAKGKGVYIGAVAPMGAYKVGFQYADNSTIDRQALELFANYALSKRTSVYADYVNVTGSLRKYSYGIGLIHKF